MYFFLAASAQMLLPIDSGKQFAENMPVNRRATDLAAGMLQFPSMRDLFRRPELFQLFHHILQFLGIKLQCQLSGNPPAMYCFAVSVIMLIPILVSVPTQFAADCRWRTSEYSGDRPNTQTFVVSRTGVIKPPVQLGVGKKSLEKKASYAILKVVWQPQKVSKEASS